MIAGGSRGIPAGQQIRLYHPRFVIGHVLEQIMRTHIAEGVDAAHRCALVLVDRHPALLVERQSRRGHVQLITVGGASGGDQQHIAGHR